MCSYRPPTDDDRLPAPAAPLRPRLGPGVYVAPSAVVCGDVEIGADSTVMHHVTIRGDVSAVRIGARVNVQDGTIIHTKTGVPLEIADEVGIGHRAVVHCLRVGPRTLIGIGAIVLDDCVLGADCLIAAGAMLPPGMQVPDGKVVMGLPARIVRDISDAERGYIRFVRDNYLRLNRLHAAGYYPPLDSQTSPS